MSTIPAHLSARYSICPLSASSRGAHLHVCPPVDGGEVVAYTDRLVRNAVVLTEGNRLRATALASMNVLIAASSAVCAGRVAFFERCFELLQDDLSVLSFDAVTDRAIPYALTGAGLAATA